MLSGIFAMAIGHLGVERGATMASSSATCLVAAMTSSMRSSVGNDHDPIAVRHDHIAGLDAFVPRSAPESRPSRGHSKTGDAGVRPEHQTGKPAATMPS